MKPIELKEEHKSKLLEMCKELFPEHPNLRVRDSMEDFCMNQDNCFIELQESGRNTKEDTIIHWFEFCMFYLSKKIFKELYKLKGKKDPNNKNYIGTMYDKQGAHNCYISMITKHGEHAIGYLYSEFLKLK